MFDCDLVINVICSNVYEDFLRFAFDLYCFHKIDDVLNRVANNSDSDPDIGTYLHYRLPACL